MKHNFKQTVILLGWFFSSIIIGLFAGNKFSKSTATIDINPWILGVVILSTLLISAFVWLKLMKLKKLKNMLEIVFSLGIGVLILDGFLLIRTPLDSIILSSLENFFIVWGSSLLMYNFIKKMQGASWEEMKTLIQINNLIMIVILAIAAAKVSAEIPPIVAIGLLLCVAFYDAWMVWKSKQMIVMAKFFLKKRMFPGIAIAKKKKEEFALLGGGDIFFIILVASSFFKTDPLTAYITATTMTLSVLALFAFSSKKKFYPAIPFIFSGLFVGLIIRMVI